MLSRYLQVMAANEPGVRDDLDSEFLHDFRVAVRRVRSLLTAAKDVLPEAERASLASEFRWLGAVTTPVRDFDVLLEDLETMSLPKWHDHLGPFRSVLEQWRAAARGELIAALGSDRYRAALADAQRLATSPGGDSPPALLFIGRRIGVAAKRVRKLGRAAETAPDWHEVRKAAKRLRYLVDGFGSLYPPETVAPALRELKRMQTTLGELQDRAVHAELAERVARALAAQPAVSANPPVTTLSLVAAGALAQWHLDRGEQAYRDCAATFARFDRKRVRAQFRELSWDTHSRVSSFDAAALLDKAAPVDPADEEGARAGHARARRPAVVKVVAVYSHKGGVGKTTTAVSLAAESARRRLRTLLWDLDPQGAATYLLRVATTKAAADVLVNRPRKSANRIRGTNVELLDVLPADLSLRNLDLALDRASGRRGRLARVVAELASGYDVIWLDCPPAITLVAENIFAAAEALVVPVIPSPLALRTIDQLDAFLTERGGAIWRAGWSSPRSTGSGGATSMPWRTPSPTGPTCCARSCPWIPPSRRWAWSGRRCPASRPTSPARAAYEDLWIELAGSLPGGIAGRTA